MDIVGFTGTCVLRQVRVGYKNKDFRIFKFRSMRIGSELLILNRIDILILASKTDKNRYS